MFMLKYVLIHFGKKKQGVELESLMELGTSTLYLNFNKIGKDPWAVTLRFLSWGNLAKDNIKIWRLDLLF